MAIWYSQQGAAEKPDELKQLISKRDTLQSEIETLEKNKVDLDVAEEKLELWEDQLYSMIRQYRDACDFPEHASKLILARVDVGVRSVGKMILSLPDGKHQLKVEISKVNSKTKEAVLLKRLDYELPGSAAYRLDLDLPKNEYPNRDKPTQLRLLIKSDSDLFESVSEKLFEPMVRPTDSESKGRRTIIAFPNEHRLIGRDTSTTVNLIPQPGLELADIEWSMRPPNEAPFELIFNFRIFSPGPSVVDASIANFYFSNPAVKSKLYYLGDGRYGIEEVEKQ